jgi:hypothetical protein
MKLDVFSVRDLQNCIAILETYSSTGVSNTKEILSDIRNHINNIVSPNNINQPVLSVKKCPSCNSIMQSKAADGLMLFACKKCRYSEIVK